MKRLIFFLAFITATFRAVADINVSMSSYPGYAAAGETYSVSGSAEFISPWDESCSMYVTKNGSYFTERWGWISGGYCYLTMYEYCQDEPGGYTFDMWASSFESNSTSVGASVYSNSPNLSVEYLLPDETPLAIQNGYVHVQRGVGIRTRLTATSGGHPVARIQWRFQKPGNAIGSNPGSQWSWAGYGWAGETAFAGGTWTSDSFNIDTIGTCDFWYHANGEHYLGWGSVSPWNENLYGWRTTGGPDVIVSNYSPTNDLSVVGSVYVGESISFTQTANNPTVHTDYLTGFRIHERREDLSNVAYENWTQLNYEAPATGNRSYSTTRPAPDRPGRIIYHIRSWNHTMNDYENLREIIVQVPNRLPTVTISPSSTQSIYYGESMTFSSTVADGDNNLTNHNWSYRNPDGTWNVQGGSVTPVAGTASGGTSSRSATLTPHGAVSGAANGSWLVQFSASDNGAQSWVNSSGVTVDVVKTTPTGTFGDKAVAEGTALSSAHLNAVFANPYNNSLSVPGGITYTIVAGGVHPFGNGTSLQTGQSLPASTYTVRGSIATSANYHAAFKDATFTVSANGNADNDGDGVNNATEIELGTNPNVAGQINPSALQLNIHTPRP